MSVLTIPIFFSDKIISKEFSFMCIVSLAGTVMMIFFNLWNWLLCLKGFTALEFWDSNLGLNKFRLKKFSFDTWKDNFFYIFGTRDLFNALFIPSIVRIPFSGLEISRILNSKFKLDNIEEIYNSDISFKEENKNLNSSTSSYYV